MGRHRKSEVEQQCDLIQEARTHVLVLAELLEAHNDSNLDGQYGWDIVDDLSPLEGLGPAVLRDLALLLDPLNPLAEPFARRITGPQK
jgi:hypothetical protein